MAGKLGMKQARPRTSEERDAYALARIEELLDRAGVEGRGIKDWTPQRLKAIEIRYSRLRPTLQATEITDRREGWADLLQRLTDQRVIADYPPKLVSPEPIAADSLSVGKPEESDTSDSPVKDEGAGQGKE